MKKDLIAALAAVKALLFADTNPPVDDNPPAEKLDVKGKDGKAYRVDTLEAGSAIEMADESGVYAPALDGDIELEDGSIITAKDGKIESIKAPEAMADAKPPADAPPADAPPVDVIPDTVSRVEFETLVGRLASIQTQLDNFQSSLFLANEMKMKAMFEVMEALSNESEEKPTGDKKHNAFKAAKTEKEIARQKLKEAMLTLTLKRTQDHNY